MPAEREVLTHPLVKQHNKDSRLECRPCLFVRSCPRFNWCSLEPLSFRRLLLKGHQKFSLNFWSVGAGIWMLKKMEYLLNWSRWTCINKLQPSSESLRVTNLVFIGSTWNRWELSVLIYLTATFWRELRRAIIFDVSRYCLVKEMAIYIYSSHCSNLRAEDWCCSDQKRSYLAREWPFYEFCLEWLNSGGDFWYK